MTPEISSQNHSPNIRRSAPVACDILIGGRPAGPTAVQHPDFGDARSLRPAKLTLLAKLTPLERLGVAEKVRSARMDPIHAEPEPKTCGQEPA
jgi:hypothetical protein